MLQFSDPAEEVRVCLSCSVGFDIDKALIPMKKHRIEILDAFETHGS
jgi:hypothetical protein